MDVTARLKACTAKANDVGEGPLDMTVKKRRRVSSPPSHLTVSSTQPDICCAPPRSRGGDRDDRPVREITIITAESTSESLVDQHFQRSLGTRYCKLFENTSSFSSSSSSVSSTTSKSRSPATTAARSKSRSPSPAISPDSSLSTHYEDPVKAFREEMEMNSVEDHFAKSLGNTWLKLQAAQSTATATAKPTLLTL